MYIRGAYAMSGSNSITPFDVNQITHFLLGLQNPLLEALKPDDYVFEVRSAPKHRLQWRPKMNKRWANQKVTT